MDIERILIYDQSNASTVFINQSDCFISIGVETAQKRFAKAIYNFFHLAQVSIIMDAQALAKEWKMDEKLIERLKELNIEQFFAIQQQVIPQLLNGYQDMDMCVSAPTGSGKTLVYVLPIVQRLLNRVICRLRAVVVVPSRDLAIQVKQVFDNVCKATDLKCGLAIGQKKFSAEQKSLVGTSGSMMEKVLGRSDDDGAVPNGGQSKVDILVATPGRLVDHIDQTPGFTLQHVEFLVVDEADRLLNQPYHDWTSKIYSDIYSPVLPELSNTRAFDPTTHRSRNQSTGLYVPLQRIILSATLTNNPKKLASLELRNPLVVSINSQAQGEDGTDQVQQHATPESLKEYLVQCEANEKPLMLLELLEGLKGQKSIVFTSSLESTHRVCLLLQSFGIANVEEYSSQLSQKQRVALLTECQEGRVDVLVCSDALTRGMDIHAVENVINYDAPSQITTYIHRAGRTARAGRSGKCITILKRGQRKSFLRMLEQAPTSNVEEYPVDKERMEQMTDKFTESLQELKVKLEEESSGVKRKRD